MVSVLFCVFRQLMDDSLSQTAGACPLIEHLILSSCLSIDVRGLSSLHCLQKLALLDLSYTFLMNLKPVFDSCLQLKVPDPGFFFKYFFVVSLVMQHMANAKSY